MSSDSLFVRVDRLLSGQLQGVLATQQDALPYTSLMAFAHTADLRQLVIATYRDTQKHANLLANPQISFLVDNRSNSAIDYQQAVAISVRGRAFAVAQPESDALLQIYLRKHPPLGEFVSSPNCVLIGIEVTRYRVISLFQTVEVLSMAGD